MTDTTPTQPTRDTRPHIITRDGVPVAGPYADDWQAYGGLLRLQGQSTDHAIRYEGYAVVPVVEGLTWSDPDTGQAYTVTRHADDDAASVRRSWSRNLTDHGHGWHFTDADDRTLTRENCGACALAGYGAGRDRDYSHGYTEPNYAGWERVYVTTGRAVGPRFRSAFTHTLANTARNHGYACGLLSDVVTYGLPDGVSRD